jgi:hypothetical protein
MLLSVMTLQVLRDHGGKLKKSRRRQRLIGCAAAAAAAAGLLLVPGAAVAKVPGGFYGLAPSTVLNSSEFQLAHSGGVRTVRPLFGWTDIEPTQNNFSWSQTDAEMANAAANGIDLVPNLFLTPTWATGCNTGAECYYIAPLGGQKQADWTNFLTQVVHRYGPSGTFWSDPSNVLVPYRPIRSWIIWNEEGSRGYFKPQASPALYAQLLQISSNAIKAVEPGAQIVLGGLAGGAQVARNAGSFTPKKFLTQLYQEPGVKNYFDVVSLHPYSATIKEFKNEITKDRAVIKAHDRKTPLWLTEVGWGSGHSSSHLDKGLQGQARILKSAFKAVLANRTAWKVQKVFWFTWRDVGPTQCSWCAAAGLFDINLNPKPSWAAYKHFALNP